MFSELPQTLVTRLNSVGTSSALAFTSLSILNRWLRIEKSRIFGALGGNKDNIIETGGERAWLFAFNFVRGESSPGRRNGGYDRSVKQG